jgi:hypothetical protein
MKGDRCEVSERLAHARGEGKIVQAGSVECLTHTRWRANDRDRRPATSKATQRGEQRRERNSVDRPGSGQVDNDHPVAPFKRSGGYKLDLLDAPNARFPVGGDYLGAGCLVGERVAPAGAALSQHRYSRAPPHEDGAGAGRRSVSCDSRSWLETFDVVTIERHQGLERRETNRTSKIDLPPRDAPAQQIYTFSAS